jgi:hypothetical protein
MNLSLAVIAFEKKVVVCCHSRSLVWKLLISRPHTILANDNGF